jgi:hypothetical protein
MLHSYIPRQSKHAKPLASYARNSLGLWVDRKNGGNIAMRKDPRGVQQFNDFLRYGPTRLGLAWFRMITLTILLTSLPSYIHPPCYALAFTAWVGYTEIFASAIHMHWLTPVCGNAPSARPMPNKGCDLLKVG